MKFKGITVGTYISKKPKGNFDTSICANCKNNYKDIEKEKQYELCKGCDKFYVSKTCKAVLTTGRDKTTGKTLRKNFVSNTEEEALKDALQYKLDLDNNGGVRIITKTNKTLVDLVKPLIDERFQLNQIKQSTYKRKLDTLKQMEKASFMKKPIAKVSREDIVNYLSSIKTYSESTIKQNYELLCMGFGEAYHQAIINDNFMTGYKRVEKPKSEYNSHHRISLTIDEQKKLINFLNNTSYSRFKHKYLFLLLLSTGMRIGEALVLDYKKDIDLEQGTITIRRTQTKDTNGKSRIGETTKTSSGQRVIAINDFSRKALEGAMKHLIPNKFHLLFYNPTNKKYGLYEEGSINSALKRAGLKLNIGLYEDTDTKGNKVTRTDIHTHMLRGTFASRCAEAKIDPNVLKEMLGHSDISITMQYYIDVDTDFIKSESNNIVNYLISKNIFGATLDSKKVVA